MYRMVHRMQPRTGRRVWSDGAAERTGGGVAAAQAAEAAAAEAATEAAAEAAASGAEPCGQARASQGHVVVVGHMDRSMAAVRNW